MHAEAFGRHAVLISCDASVVHSVAARARSALTAVDVVPGAASVLVDGVEVPTALEAIARWEAPSSDAATGPVVEIAVRYDGPDLGDVAAHWRTSVPEAIATHSGLEYVVAFCGFSPGFAYCGGLPAALSVPRLESPRPRVPAGSVAVADRWTGIYPTASPGGWRILGSTGAELWRSDRNPPALLVPGMRVRFVEA